MEGGNPSRFWVKPQSNVALRSPVQRTNAPISALGLARVVAGFWAGHSSVTTRSPLPGTERGRVRQASG